MNIAKARTPMCASLQKSSESASRNEKANRRKLIADEIKRHALMNERKQQEQLKRKTTTHSDAVHSYDSPSPSSQSSTGSSKRTDLKMEPDSIVKLHDFRTSSYQKQLSPNETSSSSSTATQRPTGLIDYYLNNDLKKTLLRNGVKTAANSPLSVGCSTSHNSVMYSFTKTSRSNVDSKSKSPPNERHLQSDSENMNRLSSNYESHIASGGRHFDASLLKPNMAASPYSCPSSSPVSYSLPSQQSHLSQGQSMPSSISPNGGTPGSAVTGPKQLSKLKRFLTTVHTFATDISPEIGDRVKNLILNLVNGTISIEEFHTKLQEATNFPLRPFVIPFLKTSLPLLQNELMYMTNQSAKPSSLTEYLASAQYDDAGNDSSSALASLIMTANAFHPVPLTTASHQNSSMASKGIYLPGGPLQNSDKNPQGLESRPESSNSSSNYGKRKMQHEENGKDDLSYFEHTPAKKHQLIAPNPYPPQQPYSNQFFRSPLTKTPSVGGSPMISPPSTSNYLSYPSQQPASKPTSALTSLPNTNPSPSVSYLAYNSSNAYNSSSATSMPFVPPINKAANSISSNASPSVLSTLSKQITGKSFSHVPVSASNSATNGLALPKLPINTQAVNGESSKTDAFRTNLQDGQDYEKHQSNSLVTLNGFDDNTHDDAREDDFKTIDNILGNVVEMANKAKRMCQLLQFRMSVRYRSQIDFYERELKKKFDDTVRVERAENSKDEAKKKADEAIFQARKQAFIEMQKAISGTEQMTEKAQRERDSYEAFMKEARKKFIDEANPYFRQEDNLAENCWNCGRKAFETCSGCRQAKYCSQFCQHKHWDMIHHKSCLSMIGRNTEPVVYEVVDDKASESRSSSAKQDRVKDLSPNKVSAAREDVASNIQAKEQSEASLKECVEELEVNCKNSSCSSVSSSPSVSPTIPLKTTNKADEHVTE